MYFWCVQNPRVQSYVPIQGYQNGQIGPKTAKNEPKRTFDAISSRFGHICTVFDKEMPKVPNFHIFLRVLDFFGLRTRFKPITTISFQSTFDPDFLHVQTRHRLGTVYGQKWMGKLSGTFFSFQNITVHPPMTQRCPLRGRNLGQTARKTTQNNRISAQNCPKIKHI